ncbi:hypothetical protein ACQY0O_004831 [Thecaphora frezii]
MSSGKPSCPFPFLSRSLLLSSSVARLPISPDCHPASTRTEPPGTTATMRHLRLYWLLCTFIFLLSLPHPVFCAWTNMLGGIGNFLKPLFGGSTDAASSSLKAFETHLVRLWGEERVSAKLLGDLRKEYFESTSEELSEARVFRFLDLHEEVYNEWMELHHSKSGKERQVADRMMKELEQDSEAISEQDRQQISEENAMIEAWPAVNSLQKIQPQLDRVVKTVLKKPQLAKDPLEADPLYGRTLETLTAIDRGKLAMPTKESLYSQYREAFERVENDIRQLKGIAKAILHAAEDDDKADLAKLLEFRKIYSVLAELSQARWFFGIELQWRFQRIEAKRTAQAQAQAQA